MDFLEGYFAFFRADGYATFALIFSIIYLISTMIKLGELALDYIKVKRGYYDR